MKKSYFIQHDAFFADVGYVAYVSDYPVICLPQPTGMEIRLSQLLRFTRDEKLELFVSSIPLQLFPPLLILDVYPSLDDKDLWDYYQFLLSAVIRYLFSHQVFPQIEFQAY